MTETVAAATVESANLDQQTVQTPADVEYAEVENQDNNEAENQTDDNSGEGEGDEDKGSGKPNRQLQRANKKIAKLYAMHAETREQNAKLMQALEAIAKNGSVPQQERPNADNYQNYGDFLKEDVKHDVLPQVKTEIQSAIDNLVKQQSELAWKNQRAQTIEQQAQVLVKGDLPDYLETVQPYTDYLNKLPDQVVNAWLSMDNAPLAAYQLIKEDAIDELFTMNAAQAKATLDAAVKRAQRDIQVRKTTKAPQPMTAVKGMGAASKTLDRMNADELVKWALGR